MQFCIYHVNREDSTVNTVLGISIIIINDRGEPVRSPAGRMDCERDGRDHPRFCGRELITWRRSEFRQKVFRQSVIFPVEVDSNFRQENGPQTVPQMPQAVKERSQVK